MTVEGKRVEAIIPAFNEEASLPLVLSELPSVVDRVIVCDNGSTDRTSQVAQQGGAVVVIETEKGYGAACLRAAEEVSSDTDILLFVDADYSDFPAEAVLLLEPIARGECDLVVGSRMLTLKDHRALPPVAAFGNWLTTGLIKLFWSVAFTDIGPFRAIRYDAYRSLGMKDRNFGWTVEMQVRAIKQGLVCREVPVSYRERIGKSKISGTIYGSIRAGIKFIWIIIREVFRT